MLIKSLATCSDENGFIDWWVKFSLYFNRNSNKLYSKKRKKLRKLSSGVDVSRFEELVTSFSFKADLDYFEESLPEDAENLVNLLVMADSEPDKGEDRTKEGNFEKVDSGKNNSAVLENGRFRGKFVSESVVNLSSRKLSEPEISLLSKGLRFIPTPTSINFAEIKEDLEKFGRNLRLKWYFRDSEENFSYDLFKPKSTFNPRKVDASIEIYLSRLEEELENISNNYKSGFNNLTSDERKALYSLKNDKSIIIKGADKGSAVIVWDREDYIKEADSQLGDASVYEEITADPLPALKRVIQSSLRKIKDRREISQKTLDYFMVNNPKLGRFYLLPKIHKRLENVPGRPVISNSGYFTENISSFVDFHLQPLIKNVKSYIKDTYDFLKKIKSLPPLPENAILCTIDVVGLYPNIPHVEGLSAIRKALDEREDKTISTDSLVELAELVLKNNIFEFGEKVFKQKQGTAIGTKMAPPYAILFMDDLETRILEYSTFKPSVWWRYIDDIFLIWEHGEENLKSFIECLDTFHPSIKFTHKWSNQTVDFLDVQVTIKENKLSTDLFVKPTDTHQYLHSSSCHAFHSKRSIPYSQALRLNKICSDNDTFDKRCNQLEEWLLKRGYNSRLVRDQILKARRFSREELLNKIKEPVERKLTVNITYHPAFSKLKDILKRIHLLLTSDREHEKVFPEVPIVGFRRAKSLKEHLVRAKLPSLTQGTGCGKCGGSRCDVCNYIEASHTFSDKNGARIFDIRKGVLNCNSTNVIYLMQCKVCALQYVGSTINKFRYRFNNYKSKHTQYRYKFSNSTLQTGNLIQQASFHSHFCQSDHNGLSDWSVKLIDQAHDEGSLRRQESFWQHKLKTFSPDGLNEKEVPLLVA